ncbi:hypothetical protein NYE70_12125 [Paenibacillus sp. FSL R5-0407]|uniref:hypothetical protein n=1 Tax=Paenibacillus sp. FSL R5-0407 TaxID=2975320 RepID=UPI0030F8B5CF
MKETICGDLVDIIGKYPTRGEECVAYVEYVANVAYVEYVANVAYVAYVANVANVAYVTCIACLT